MIEGVLIYIIELINQPWCRGEPQTSQSTLVAGLKKVQKGQFTCYESTKFYRFGYTYLPAYYSIFSEAFSFSFSFSG